MPFDLCEKNKKNKFEKGSEAIQMGHWLVVIIAKWRWLPFNLTLGVQMLLVILLASCELKLVELVQTSSTRTTTAALALNITNEQANLIVAQQQQHNNSTPHVSSAGLKNSIDQGQVNGLLRDEETSATTATTTNANVKDEEAQGWNQNAPLLARESVNCATSRQRSLIDESILLLNNKSNSEARVEDEEEEQKRLQRRAAAGGVGGNNNSHLPMFAAPIGNVSAVLGRDVRLVCTVDNLGHHQVAWLKEETKTILSIDTNIIITNYRIFLIPDEEGRKWVLHIKDVQESDRGFYQCQVNSNPRQSMSGYLEVVVPPTMIEQETSQVAEIIEHSNVSIQCKARGHPRPTISWRREDGEPIRLTGSNYQGEIIRASSSDLNNSRADTERISRNDPTAASSITVARYSSSSSPSRLNDIKSDKLSLINVDRTMAGLYVCTASNGIPSQVSRQIPVYVKFAPKVSIEQETTIVYANLGSQLELVCLIEAFPKPTSYWSGRRQSTSTSTPSGTLTRANKRTALRSSRIVHQGAGATGGGLPRWYLDTNDRRRAISVQQKQAILQGRRRAYSGATSHILAQSPDGSTSAILAQRKQRSQTNNNNQDDDNDSDADTDDGDPVVVDDDKRSTTGRELDFEPGVNVTTSQQPVAAAAAAPSQPGIWSGSANLTATTSQVTVSQSALNAYTYKLKMVIAKVRPSDLGEYVCISSNSMGTSSGRVQVRVGKSAAANGAQPPFESMSQSIEIIAPPDNQADYQRDSLISETAGNLWSSSGNNQLVQVTTGLVAPSKHDKDDNTGAGQPLEQSRANKPATSQRQTNRVYDENYLQTIRNRQLSAPLNGYLSSSSGLLGKPQQKLLQTSFGEQQQQRNSATSSTTSHSLAMQSLLVNVAWMFGGWYYCSRQTRLKLTSNIAPHAH